MRTAASPNPSNRKRRKPTPAAAAILLRTGRRSTGGFPQHFSTKCHWYGYYELPPWWEHAPRFMAGFCMRPHTLWLVPLDAPDHPSRCRLNFSRLACCAVEPDPPEEVRATWKTADAGIHIHPIGFNQNSAHMLATCGPLQRRLYEDSFSIIALFSAVRPDYRLPLRHQSLWSTPNRWLHSVNCSTVQLPSASTLV